MSAATCQSSNEPLSGLATWTGAGQLDRDGEQGECREMRMGDASERMYAMMSKSFWIQTVRGSGIQACCNVVKDLHSVNKYCITIASRTTYLHIQLTVKLGELCPRKMEL